MAEDFGDEAVNIAEESLSSDFEGSAPGEETPFFYDGQPDSNSAEEADSDTVPAFEREDGGIAEERGPIPYDRFAQVIHERDQAKAWEPIVDMFRQQGFDSPDDVIEAIQTQEADAQIRAQLDPIASTLAAKVEAGEYDWNTAEVLWAAERERVLAANDRAMYQQWRVGQEMQAAQQYYPEMDPEYVIALHQMTGAPVTELARASHEYHLAVEQQVLARYQAQKAAASAVPAPEGYGGHEPFTAQGGGDAWKQSWRSLFGIGRSG